MQVVTAITYVLFLYAKYNKINSRRFEIDYNVILTNTIAICKNKKCATTLDARFCLLQMNNRSSDEGLITPQ